MAWILLGYFAINSVPGNPNRGRALFTAINAATLTGFQHAFPVESLTSLGQWGVLAMVIGGSLFSMIVSSLAVVRILRLRYSDWQMIAAAAIVEVIAIALGTSILAQHNTVLASMLTAASAFGNCGVYAGTLPACDHWTTHVAILPLSVLGGLGLPVLMECIDAVVSRKPTSLHTRTVLVMTAWIYVIGLALLLTLDLSSRHYLTRGPWPQVRQPCWRRARWECRWCRRGSFPARRCGWS